MTYCCHIWSHQRAARMVTFLQTPWKLPSHLLGSWASSKCSWSPLPLVNPSLHRGGSGMGEAQEPCPALLDVERVSG